MDHADLLWLSLAADFADITVKIQRCFLRGNRGKSSKRRAGSFGKLRQQVLMLSESSHPVAACRSKALRRQPPDRP